MRDETIYDLIILGGGPAGYNAAERAAHGGLKTLLFEERALGGVCLNEGCIPTKTLLYSAKILDYAHHGEAYGVTVTGASLDHAKVVDRKDKVVKTLVSGVGAKMKASPSSPPPRRSRERPPPDSPSRPTGRPMRRRSSSSAPAPKRWSPRSRA